MNILEREGLANAATAGEAMLSRLREWPLHHSILGDVRGRGLMIGLEIVRDPQTREAAPALRDRIVRLAFERGLLTLGCGESSIRLAPPLIVNGHEANIALDILEECLGMVERDAASPPKP
jgi:4-aminobutyrate aminotransferase